MAKKWFVLRVQSNKEDKVKGDLEKRVKIQGIESLVSQILVPSEKVSEIKGGKKKVVERKIYPGYIMAEIEVGEKGEIPEEVWYMIRDVPGAGDFVGGDSKPIAMENSEVEKLLKEAEQGEDKPKAEIDFNNGDRVRVKEGPFENFEGVVEEVLPASGCLKLMLTIFGRPTPVELEYWQVEAL